MNPQNNTLDELDEIYEALSEILAKPKFDHPVVGVFGLFDISPTKTSDVWGVTLTEDIIELFKAQLSVIEKDILELLPNRKGYTEEELEDLRFALSHGMRVKPKEISGTAEYEDGYNQALAELRLKLKEYFGGNEL
jgi:TolB-like protein